jgi:hypothetical protein
MSAHEAAQRFEVEWWGDCCATWNEERKQITYADRMGILTTTRGGNQWPVYDARGASVLDIGGGPVSMLLKTFNVGAGKIVVDPGEYPEWVYARYKAARVTYIQQPAEQFELWDIGTQRPLRFDECWLYNVLQHVIDPERVIAVARRHSRLVRVFEWVLMPAHEGHPHELSPADLDRWLDVPVELGDGVNRRNRTVEYFDGEDGLIGTAYSGAFDA